MPLTESEVQTVSQWLKSHGVKGSCASCGRHEWALVDVVTAPISDSLSRTTETIPLVATACSNCGQVVLFSAVMMGIR